MFNTYMKVNVKKVAPNAVVPSYSKEGDAGLDLTITSIVSDDEFQVTYDTGLAFEIPSGYVGLVFPRSSVRKYDLSLSNAVGVIDSSYRGTVQATFRKTVLFDDAVVYNVGDRALQLIIIPYPSITLVEVDELSSTDRGTGGFGSTGN